jgi:hypothetical protein
MAEFMTEQQRLAQRHYIELVLSGKRRKVSRPRTTKRKKLPSTLAWS